MLMLVLNIFYRQFLFKVEKIYTQPIAYGMESDFTSTCGGFDSDYLFAYLVTYLEIVLADFD